MKIATLLMLMSLNAYSAEWTYSGKTIQIEVAASEIEILTMKYPQILDDMGFELEDVKGVTLFYYHYDFNGTHTCEDNDERLELSLFSYKACLLDNHNLCYTSPVEDLPVAINPCL